MHSPRTAPTRCGVPEWAPHNMNSYSPPLTVIVNGIFKIKHVVIIMQENRSFDQYFGTFPGATDPTAGPGAVCVADPLQRWLRAAVPRHGDKNFGGPARRRQRDRGHGLHERRRRTSRWTASSLRPKRPDCTTTTRTAARARPHATQCIDVMGYHDGGDIPNYWAYAEQLRAPGPHVRAERIVEPARAPLHGLGVVARSAPIRSTRAVHERARRTRIPGRDAAQPTTRGPTSPTCSTSRASAGGTTCSRGPSPTARPTGDDVRAGAAGPNTPGIWNPLPYFTDVQQDGELGNIQTVTNFFTAAKNGTLPAVSWVVPERHGVRASRRRWSAPARRTSPA